MLLSTSVKSWYLYSSYRLLYYHVDDPFSNLAGIIVLHSYYGSANNGNNGEGLIFATAIDLESPQSIPLRKNVVD